MAQKTATEILDRFNEEVIYIQAYVEHLHKSSTIHEHQILRANTLLNAFNIPPLPISTASHAKSPLSANDLAKLVPAINKTNEALEANLAGLEQAMDAIDRSELPPDSPGFPYMELVEEIADWMMKSLPAHIKGIPETVAYTVENRTGKEKIPSDARHDLYSYAAEYTQWNKLSQIRDDIWLMFDLFDNVKLIAQTADPTASINPLRQAFILLLTVFDASVFDLVRTALQTDFFALIPKFEKNEQSAEKLTLKSLGAAGSFEAFQAAIIEEQLKRRYLRDLLFLLENEEKVNIRITKNHKDFLRLIEIVLRRNLHVHNRGVVDERYLETDENTQKPKYNLHGLKLNQVAAIDKDYWKEVLRITGETFELIAGWVKGLEEKKKPKKGRS